MLDFLSLLWNIALIPISEFFMESDFSLLIYLVIISIVICYFANLIRSLRRF